MKVECKSIFDPIEIYFTLYLHQSSEFLSETNGFLRNLSYKKFVYPLPDFGNFYFLSFGRILLFKTISSRRKKEQTKSYIGQFNSLLYDKKKKKKCLETWARRFHKSPQSLNVSIYITTLRREFMC